MKKSSKIVLALSLAMVLVAGLIVAVRMFRSPYTYDGTGTDPIALMQDPSSYDNGTADGAAAVMVNENLEKTAATNVVFSVVFNYRGYDTLGESFILIGAIAGTTAILRKKHAGKKEKDLEKAASIDTASIPEPPVKTAPKAKQKKKPVYHREPVIIRCAADALLPFAGIYGWYIVFHGATSPGGGFQGGVIIAGSVLLLFLGYGLRGIREILPQRFLHSSEAIAEISYAFIGLMGILAGTSFAFNFVFMGHRTETSMLMNDAVGYHVMAGIGCLLILMLGMLGPDTDELTGEDH